MRNTVRNVATSIALMTGSLLHSAVVSAEENESLLDAPAGLEWLESKESLINRGYISTFGDLVDVYGFDNDPNNPNAISCDGFLCYGRPNPITDTVTEFVGLSFEEDLLVGVRITYFLDVDAMPASDLETYGKGIYKALTNRLSERYENSDIGISESSFSGNAVEISVDTRSTSDSNNKLVKASVYVWYDFDTELYLELNSKQKYSEIFSQKDL